MRRRILSCLPLLLALPAGCAGERTETTAPAPTTESAKRTAPDYTALLPAFEMESEKRVPGKADQFYDTRIANPQWYALTEPPQGKSYRHMVEWEPMQMMMTTYSDGMLQAPGPRQTIIDIVYHTITDAHSKAGVIVSKQSMADDMTKGLKAKGATDAVIKDNVQYIIMPNDSIWLIDYGPLPLVDTASGAVAFADFRYYHQRVLDDAIPSRLGEETFGVTTYRMGFDIEGGTFQGDGKGRCFTGERALQYAGATAAELEAIWGDYAACTELVVMKDITDDGTGHIDMFFKLGAEDISILGEYKDVYVKDATNKQRMDDNAALLGALTAPGGGMMKVVRVPFPSKSNNTPRTYLNSTMVNGVNLWPIYSDSKDAEAEALAKWQEALPDWKHVGILCDDIAQWSGTVHCVTRTIPKGNLEKWIPDGTCSGGTCTTAADDGYAGACYGPTTDWCWGPDWLCACNECNEDGTCPEPPNETCEGSCGGQSPAGCYCDDLCSQYGDCCPDYEEVCGGGGGEGSCEGYCGNQSPDGCYCDDQCAQYGDCCTDYEDVCGGGGPGPVGCGKVTFEGCCSEDGATLSYCDNDELQVLNCGENGCGWDGENSFYDCGKEGEDPSGANPLVCPECEPSCEGKECGDDGCGGSCGHCEAGEICNAGTCEVGGGPDSCVGHCGDKAESGCYCDEACAGRGDCCADVCTACPEACGRGPGEDIGGGGADAGGGGGEDAGGGGGADTGGGGGGGADTGGGGIGADTGGGGSESDTAGGTQDTAGGGGGGNSGGGDGGGDGGCSTSPAAPTSAAGFLALMLLGLAALRRRHG